MGRLRDVWQALVGSEIKDGPPIVGSGSQSILGVSEFTSYMTRSVLNVTSIGYLNNVTVYRAVNVLATSIASLEFRVYKKDGKQERVENHPLEKLLKNPNTDKSGQSFMEQAVSYLLIGGTNYNYTPDTSLRPGGMWNLRPDLVRPYYAQDGSLIEYHYDTPMGTQKYDPRVIHPIRFFHPFDELAGLSALQVAAAVIERQNAGEEFNFNLLSNMARPSGAFVSTLDLPPMTRGRLLSEIKKKYGRGKATAGMPLLLENGLTYTQIALSPVDADWLNSDNSAGRKIAAAIGVDSLLLNDKQYSTYNNVAEAKLGMWELTGIPLLSKIEDDINFWLAPKYTDNIMVKADRRPIELLKANRAVDTGIVVSLFNNGLAPFNHCALEIGSPTIDNKDDFYRFGPAVFVRSSEIANWLDKQEEARNAPPQPVLLPQAGGKPPQNNRLLPQGAGRKPAGSVTITEENTPKKSVDSWYQELEALRESYAQPFKKELESFFKKQREKLSAQEKTGSEMVREVTLMGDEFRDLLSVQYLRVAEAAAQLVGRQFGQTSSIYKADLAPKVAAYIDKGASGITETTVKQVSALGDQSDTTLQALQESVRELYQGYVEDRTGLIAENETLTAANLGSFMAAQMLDLPIIKTWHTAQDERVRDLHAEVELQQQELDMPYMVAGEELDFPKDSYHGSAANTINCRCFETYSVDVSAGVEKAWSALSRPEPKKPDQGDDEVEEKMRPFLG